MKRRDFIRASSLLVGAKLTLGCAPLLLGETNSQNIVLLGTAGGPLPYPTRSSPANALLFDDETVIIDCGYGVARQMAKARIPLKSLRHIFITHNHSDHYADVVMLPYLAWINGLEETIRIYGPPPIRDIVAAGLEMHQFDIDLRIRDQGFPDLRQMIQVHEYDRPGEVVRTDKFLATAARNNHPPFENSFALRFDTDVRSVVFSGDTTYSKNVVELAKAADVLVHELLYIPAVEALISEVPTARNIAEHLIEIHTPTQEVGKVAAEAHVNTLVLSHLAPPFVTDEDIEEIVRIIQSEFDGHIIVGRDLLRI
jgi:ribonuclease BN (tRNA processing enzyme)